MRALAIACALVFAAGCGKKADDKAEQQGTAVPAEEVATPVVPPAKPTWSDDAKRLVAAIPPVAVAVMVVDLPQPAWDYLLAGTLVPLAEPHRGELDKELSGFLTTRLGVDVHGARSAVGFATADKQFAVMVANVGGELRGGPRLVLDKEHDFVAMMEGRILIVGTGPAVEAATGAIKGNGNLAKAQPELASWIDAELDGSLIGAAAQVSAVEQLFGEKAPAGLELAAFSLSRRGAHAAISGDPNTLKTLAAQMDIFEAQLMRSVGEMRTASTTADAPTALGALAIAEYHFAANLLDAVETKVDGRRMVVDAPMSVGFEPATLVLLAGGAAAIAIPAFTRYIAQSKASEARVQVARLAASCDRYYAEKKALPASAGPTPPPGSCCGLPDGMCVPDPSRWAVETWINLGFTMTEPHRYSYQLETRPDGYTVRAIGDLDCDGIYSTFEESAVIAGDQLVRATPSRVNELE